MPSSSPCSSVLNFSFPQLTGLYELVCFRCVWSFIKDNEKFLPAISSQNSTSGERRHCSVQAAELYKALRHYNFFFANIRKKKMFSVIPSVIHKLVEVPCVERTSVFSVFVQGPQASARAKAHAHCHSPVVTEERQIHGREI